jgi:hypothetical protein
LIIPVRPQASYATCRASAGEAAGGAGEAKGAKDAAAAGRVSTGLRKVVASRLLQG